MILNASVEHRSSYPYSGLIHAVFLGIAFILLKPIHFEFPLQERIEIESLPTLKKTETAPPSQMRTQAKAKTVPHIPLEALGMKLRSPVPAPFILQGAPKGIQATSMNFARETQQLKLWEYIFQRIDGILVYPSEFVERKMTGTVDATLYFSGTGHFLENQTQYHATSDYFKVLIAKTLRQALQDPIPESKIISHDGFSAQANFRFEFTESTYPSFEKKQSIVIENQLHFYRQIRSLEAREPIAISLQEMRTKKGPEITPVLGIDLSRLLAPKPTTDPLEKYREDPAW